MPDGLDPDTVRARLDAVIDEMKRQGLWQLARPPDDAFEDMGPFGARTMSFERWLRWVFVPQVERSLAAGGPWPDGSAVAVKAAREGDGTPEVMALVEPLSRFDALFNSPPPADADHTAAAIVQALAAAHPELAAGRRFRLQPAQPVAPGEVPFAVIATSDGERVAAHALVRDLGALVVTDTLSRQGDTLVLRHQQIRNRDVSASAADLAAWLTAGGDADPEQLTPLSAGLTLWLGLAAQVPRPAGWRLSPVTAPYQRDRPATVAVQPIGAPADQAVVVTARPGGGVTVRIPTGAHEEREVGTVSDFLARLPDLIQAAAR